MLVNVSKTVIDKYLTRAKIRLKKVRDVVFLSDHFQSLKVEQSGDILLYSRVDSGPGGTTYILVLATPQGENIRIDSAYRVPAEGIQRGEEGEVPLLLLERFLDRFGIPVSVGSKTGRLIVDETIPTNPDANTPIMDAHPPKDHDFDSCAHIMPLAKSGDKITHIACSLAFLVDMTEYRAWLDTLNLA